MKVALLTIASWLAVSPAAGLPQAAVKQVKQGVTVFNDRVTAHFLPMRKQTVSPAAIHPSLPRRNTPARLRNVYDVYYIVDLVVGNQTIPVSVDTGSSDTWLVQEPYECVSFWVDYPGGKPNCGLGAGFKGNLSGGTIPDIPPFLRSYVDGTFVRGYFGREEVSIGGITAHSQRIAIVNYTYWRGDGQTSGLLGLGYPYLTSLDGSDENQPPYDPVFTTMWKSGDIDPLFSIALSRNESKEESYLALGGLPPIEVDETTWARTPLHPMSAVPEWMFETEEKGLYIIKPDAYVIGKSGGDTVKNATQIPVLIDVGATLSMLPKDLVNQLYAAFDPPAKYLSSTGLFFAPCNATVPTFGVQIGNSTFYIPPEDLLRQAAKDPTGEWCRVGVTDTNGPPYVLGVTFLSNVVAVFDVGKSEMRFAARKEY